MGSAKKNFKATKKFEKNQLKGVLEKRKATSKIKQRQQVKDKKKAKRARDSEFYKNAKDEVQDGSMAHATHSAAKVSEMSVDTFFQGGFEDLIDAQVGKADNQNRETTSTRKGRSNERSRQSSHETVSSPDDNDSDGEEAMSGDMIEGLAHKDPEFYQYLRDNDPEVLDFDLDADLAEVDELSGDEKTEVERDKPQKKKRKKSNEATYPDDAEEPQSFGRELTCGLVASWREAMTTKHSLRATRQVVLAFRCAARHNQYHDEVNDDNIDKTPRWTINSPDVFNDVVVLALKEIPTVMNHHVPVKESAAGNIYVQTESRKFKTLSTLLKSYTSSILHLLTTLSDEKTIKLTLSAMTPLLPYLLSFRKLVKALAKAVIAYWTQPISSETTRLTAFLVVRRLVVIGDKAIREAVLKATYQGLVQSCRVTNHNTLQGINIVKQCAAELWGIDASVGYTTAFAFIRQLAMHLRSAMVKPQNESFRSVYNWQFFHSLDFWSIMLSQHCNTHNRTEVASKLSQLKLLIYPLTQLTLGTTRLVPSASYFPLRLHLVVSLLRLSRATGVFIPLASPLLDILYSAELRKRPQPSTLKPLDLSLTLRAPRAQLGTRVYQDVIADSLIDQLGEFLAIWATSVAFPELVLPVVIQLKRWLKTGRSPSRGHSNSKITAQLAHLVHKLEANAAFIQQRRAGIDFAPRDRTQVETFLADFELMKTPLGAFVVTQRQVRAQRAQAVAEALQDDSRVYHDNVEMEVETDDDQSITDGHEALDEDDDSDI